MRNFDKFVIFFQELERFNIKSTKECFKDLTKIITTDVDNTLTQILKDFIILDINGMNRFEKIKLSDSQKQVINGANLYRYEYRKYSNLRILFFLETREEVYLICAFNEIAGKKKSKDSYSKNIQRAINITKKIKGGG